jgi:glucuronate isomerase
MNFITDNFLLYNDTGRGLYHEVAAGLPIVDFHNHIDPESVATNRQFGNIQEVWVAGDPYKHRAMRICGVPESLITGDAPDFDKFMAWARCLKKTMGNPLFHWSCMELRTIFGIEEILDEGNAAAIWEKANGQLAQKDFTAQAILLKFNVELLCTSDDLADLLEHHQAFATQKADFQCLPSLRGDSIVAFGQGTFGSWLEKISQQTKREITDLDSYKKAIINRLDFFKKWGCLLSDHSFDSGFRYVPIEEAEAVVLFEKVLNKKPLGEEDVVKLQSNVLCFLGKEYAKRGWRMQLHIGAFRYTSTRLRKKVGGAGGFAAIGHTADIASLSRFLDDLDIAERLPETILYTLNPADNAAFASLTGSFSQDGVAGKIQFGPAWWYNDHYQGITEQLKTLASYGLLSTAIGMTTDSRSIFSMTRHDYYRRILCNLVGEWVENGQLPDDKELLKNLIEDISYNNVQNWLSNE